MNLSDVTLDLARYAQGIKEFTVVSYVSATKTLTVSAMSGKVGEYGGGTVWFMDGLCSGSIRRIANQSSNKIILDEDLSATPAAGDKIAAATFLYFDKDMLVSAVNSVLYDYQIMKYNTNLAFDSDVRYYTLPSEVTRDIRRLEIWKTDSGSGHYEICHKWNITGRELEFYGDPNRYEDGASMRISYVDRHGSVTEVDEIDDQVIPEYIRYLGFLYLYQNQIQTRLKDNLIASDML
jgi:hypothetical protein